MLVYIHIYFRDEQVSDFLKDLKSQYKFDMSPKKIEVSYQFWK